MTPATAAVLDPLSMQEVRVARPGGTRRWLVLAMCLLAPAGASLLRKIVPGQPAALEIGGAFMILLAMLWLMLHPRKLPSWLVIPLVVWGYFQLLYAALAMQENWKIFAAATMVRVIPMMMAPIAYAAVRTSGDFRRASTWVTAVAPVLVPVGLVVAFYGNEVLPGFLQPIQQLIDMGRSGRAGVDAVSGIFSTYAVLSMSMLGVLFVALANLALAESRRERTTMWWLAVVSAMLLIFLSTRRGAFLAALVGLGYYGFTRRRLPLRYMIPIVAVIGVAGGYEIYQLIQSAETSTRAQLILQAFSSSEIMYRLVGIFGPLVWTWLQLTPFGTYLGFAGPEGKALATGTPMFTTELVEVGGAQLLAETGILGALLMPAIVVFIVYQLRKRSRGLRCRRAVMLLALFQVLFFALYYLKELSAMTGVSMAQVFFWAAPGIAAGLIERERRERGAVRILQAVYRQRAREAASA